MSSEWILQQFHADPRTARRHYRAFVAEGGNAYRPWEALGGGMVLGTDAFRTAVARRLGSRIRDTESEVPRRQRSIGRPSVEALSAATADRGTWMANAYREHGYTMVEIADAAGLHHSSVSKIIKAFERR